MATKKAKQSSPKKPKRPRDVNQLAHFLVKQATERGPKPDGPTDAQVSEVMKELGRRGGRVGGKNRMALLTEEERSDLASKAARARWKKERA